MANVKKNKNHFESILIPVCCSLILVFVLGSAYVFDFMILEFTLPDLYMKGLVSGFTTVLILLAITKRQVNLGYGAVLIACISLLWLIAN